MKDRRTEFLNILFFLIHLIAYGYFFEPNNWNSNSRYGLTMAMVERGTLSVDAYHATPGWNTGDVSFFEGHYYSDKPPGTSLLGALFFWPIHALSQLAGTALEIFGIKYFISFTSIALPSALGALLVFLVAQKIAGNIGMAFWASIAVTLGTIFWPFATTFMNHSLTSTLIFGAFFLGFQFYSADKVPDRRRLFLIGLMMGFGFITDYAAAFVIIWVLGYLLYKGCQRGRLVESFFWIGFGSAIAISPALIYNFMIFHTPFASAYSYLVDNRFASGMSKGLMGIGWPDWKVMLYLTIHPTMGILWESPVLMLAVPVYLKIASQKYKAELLMTLGIVFSMLVMLSGYYIWWDGEIFAPRHLTTIMLFMVIPLASLASRIKPWLIVSTIFSALQMFLAVSTTLFVSDSWAEKLNQLPLFDTLRYSILYNTLLPLFLSADLSSNLGKKLFTNPYVSLLPFVLLEGIFFVWFYLVATDRVKVK